MNSGYVKLIRNWAVAFLVPRPLIGALYLRRYVSDWREYVRQAEGAPLRVTDSHPCLTDWLPRTPFDPHYFYQGAWLARALARDRPACHVDIGSSVNTVGVLSALVDTIFVDYRPLFAELAGLRSVGADITALPFGSGTMDSLSCLHVIEHIGLGRYGDPIDPAGSAKAAGELQRVLKPGGRLYLSAPIGRERVCFNAHRVFFPETIVSMFPGMKLREFSFVNDSAEFRENQDATVARDLDYGCGMFLFERLDAAEKRVTADDS